MNQVWDNDTEITRELDDIEKKVDALSDGASGMSEEELKSATQGLLTTLKQNNNLLKKVKVDIDYATKQSGTVDESQRAELVGRYLTPKTQQYEKIKTRLDNLQKASNPKTSEAARKELMASAVTAEREEEMEMQELSPAQMQQTALTIQDDTTAAALRAEQTVQQLSNMADHTSKQLYRQEEQIENIIDDMDNLAAQVKRARREVGQFSRRLATDKCFVCLFVLVLLAICTIVGLNIFNKSSDDSSTAEDELGPRFEDDRRR